MKKGMFQQSAMSSTEDPRAISTSARKFLHVESSTAPLAKEEEVAEHTGPPARPDEPAPPRRQKYRWRGFAIIGG